MLLKCELKLLECKRSIIAVVLLANCSIAYAAGTVSPGAGSILQQINPVERPSPSFIGTEIKIEQEEMQPLPPTAPFLARTILIIGNTQFDTLTLHSLVLDAEGQSLSSAKQAELAQRITNYYHRHGFFMARAVVSNKTALEGQVVIEVIEARYGKITLNNHSNASDDLLLDALTPFQNSQAIEQGSLDRSMLWLSDIPGVVATPTWRKPGAAAGVWWDLEVEASSGPSVTGYASLDDYGNSYNGKTRIYGAVNLINPMNHGDILTASILSSGRGMNYGLLSYEYLLNGIGTRVGGSYTALRYILSGEYEPFGEHGSAQVKSIWIRHSMVRSRDKNIYGQIQYDKKQLSDHIDSSNINKDRHLDNFSIFLYGDAQDSYLSGGFTTWNLGMILGLLGFDDENANQNDLTTAVTQAGFFKLTAYLTRLQPLSEKNSLYLSYYGQWTDGNMDDSEKIIAGGPYTVRGYDMSVLQGDTGYQATAELRHDFDQTWGGNYQAVVFIDTEHITFNKNPWGVWQNDATLSGAGIGLTWSGSNQWSGKIYVAKPIGAIPQEVVNPPSTRAWAEIGKGF